MTRIALALTEDYADWEPALLMAAARGYLGVEIVTASPDGRPVTSMGGLRVLVDTDYASLDPALFDALVISGGLIWEKGEAPAFNELIHQFRAQGKVVAGICAAASVLAGSGILDSVRHTGNSLTSHQAHGGYHGEAHYQNQPQAVSDQGVITAPGTSPFTFAREILKALGLWTEEAEAELNGFAAEFS
ncbi:thiamine biosynthesis protein ThiJ [Rhizobium sp. Root149]|uniref:type 1 glutamine amidotransferase family protein n=1 Tax=Rhizobium TaxID=379 RepID=UPI00071574BC|nr:MULTISPECIES: type 1 glutamine amidotransferase family protein [Rhizobium]KQZ63163.1 thiamine biosynthesis protein ThiJ [Rhizobium sp. Root149]